MALNIPESASEVVQRSKVDVQRELTGSDPFLKNSWLGAIVTANANRVFDFYTQLQLGIDESFPDTADDLFLDRWAAIYGQTRLAATQAEGNIVFTGTLASIITISTNLQNSEGSIYITTAAGTIANNVISVSSLTRSGVTATVVTASAHSLSSNVLITVAGAVETEYNGVQTITVVDSTTFTYIVAGTPATPATGTITAAGDFANVPVISQDFGEITNQDLDAVLTLQSPISGVDNDAQVDVGELGGGTDQETDFDLRVRLLDRIQNPIAHFSASEITALAKTINGVTRVFVQEITPDVGQVTIYFMRDNDADPIPSASEVTEVKDLILTITPANTAEVDVIVLAPTGVTQNFVFTDLQPNTATMQAAVTASLDQFFSESTQVGVDIDSDAYRSAIFSTVDTQTGDRVTTFTLSAPAGDITIASGEIGLHGSDTYP